MAEHPWNLLFRFLLELAALAAICFWGWKNYGWLMALFAPIAISVLWGVFAVPGDPSRSGAALVPIPGWFRLSLEVIILYGAAWTLKTVKHDPLALLFGALITFHYVLSYDRLAWLMKK